MKMLQCSDRLNSAMRERRKGKGNVVEAQLYFHRSSTRLGRNMRKGISRRKALWLVGYKCTLQGDEAERHR